MVGNHTKYKLRVTVHTRFSAFAISLADIDVILKLTLLAVSIGYTIQKWYILNDKNK